MNTNPNAIKILCYGDSNTWGYIPKTGQRYPVNIRWTGILQQALGGAYDLIEEGLNGRTINVDDAERVGRNSKSYLIHCLETQDPVNLIILLLGTNDLKERFHRTAEQVTQGLEELIKTIKDYGTGKNKTNTKILIISPFLVDESVEGVKDEYLGGEQKSRQLGKLYEEVAKRNGCDFLDTLPVVQPSKKDGYHLEPEEHQKLAEVFYSKIKSLYK